MKLFHLTWVLALAGAVTACNAWTDQEPIQGCELDPLTGLCPTPEGPGPGPGGSGGAGGAGGTITPLECGDMTADALFDLSNSIFKPYNSLLDDNTGSGDPGTDCAAPDLSGNPGSNLTGITAKCLIFQDPNVSGCMQFDDNGSGYDVTGSQQLSFTIDVTIASVGARVLINTFSVTDFDGTATGSLPGTLTMTDQGGNFNVNAAATGNVNCQAFNTDTGDDVSCAICPLANFNCGDNSVPLPGDPGKRTFPPITVGADSFEFGAGAADPTGWYLTNPAPLAGNGTQWAALAGAQTN